MKSKSPAQLGLLLGGFLVLSGCTSASLRNPASTTSLASSATCVGTLCAGDTVWILSKENKTYLDRTDFSSDQDQGKILDFFEDGNGNRAFVLLNNGDKIAAYPGQLLKEDDFDKPCSQTEACPGERVYYGSDLSNPSATTLGYPFKDRHDFIALELTEPGSAIRKIKLANIEFVYVKKPGICLKSKPELCIGAKIRNYNGNDDQILGAQLSSLSQNNVNFLYQENEDPGLITVANEDYILVRSQKPKEVTNNFKRSCSTKLVPPSCGFDHMGPNFEGLNFVKTCDVQWKVVCHDKRAK